MVERVCDDLIENVNNQIDLYKREQTNPEIKNIGPRQEI
jgi:hypothetical protein